MKQLDVYGLSDSGSRPKNEDFWSGPPPDISPRLAASKGLLFVVCDGMGGHQAGEIASQMAAKIVQECYYTDANLDLPVSLKAAIEEANRRIYHDATSTLQHQGMGTTLTGAVLRGNELIVANVGDSRTYLIRNETAIQLSQDHTWVAERRQAGYLNAEEARNHPQRNVITRALGNQPEVHVDVSPPLPVYRGDTLLLCTDGLSEIVQDAEMAAVVSRGPSAAFAVRHLVDLAKSRGAPDNVTVLLVGIGRGAPASLRPVSAVSAIGFVATLLILGVVGLAVIGVRFESAPTPTIAASPPVDWSPTPMPPSPLATQGIPPPPPTETLTPSPVPILTATATAVPSPPPVPPSATATPTALAMETATTPPTPTVAASVPTPTPAPPQLTFTAPDSGAVLAAGSPVELKWEWPFVLSENQRFRVYVNVENASVTTSKFYTTTQTSMSLPHLTVGNYRCVVVVEEGPESNPTPTPWRSIAITFSIKAPTVTPSPTAKPLDELRPAATTAPLTTTTPPTSPTPSPAPADMSRQPTPELLEPPPDDTAQTGTPKTFRWRWTGDLPDGWGFEVIVWKEGVDLPSDPPGAQDADYTTANMKRLPGYEYQIDIDLAGAKSCEKNGAGDYLWSVRLVHLPPNYAYIRSWPPGRHIVVSSPGGGSGGGGGDGGGGRGCVNC